MHALRAGPLAGVALLIACASVEVTPAGRGLAAKARPADCAVEFLRTKAPDRPYDELAGLHAKGGSNLATAAELQEEMRATACALGADAVIVTRDYIPRSALMTGTAVKYREAVPVPAAGARP